MDLDALLRDVDLDEMLRLYDEAAEELLQVAISDGHFADHDPGEITWPVGADLDALTRRAELIGAIHEGTPRSATSACKRHTTTTSASAPAYHQANRLYPSNASALHRTRARRRTRFPRALPIGLSTRPRPRQPLHP